MKEDLAFSSYKTVQYTYYADGLRASKTVSLDDKVMYLWNGDNIYAETTDIKNVPGERYYRGHQLICDNSNNYYMHNAHGDVVFIHNGAAELNSYTYDAFGNSDSQMKFGYCEQQYDVETGLYYMRARYYNPNTGAFISEDTHWNPYNMVYEDETYQEGKIKYPDYLAILQNSNLYSYSISNPIKYMDISGDVIVEGTLAYTAWVAMQFVIDVVAGYTAIKFIDLSIEKQNEIINATSYDSSKSVSSYIDWNKDDNGKNHVINGSKKSKEEHLSIWKKLGYSPKDPNGYNNLEKIFKEVVNSGLIYKNSQKVYERGKAIGENLYYYKDYLDEGVKVIVKIYTCFENGAVYFSDAWGELFG